MILLVFVCVVPFFSVGALQGTWSNLLPRSPPGSPRAAPQARSLAVSGGGWPTEHYNSLNSGATEYSGPGGNDGDCKVSFFDLPEDTAVRFYATGVTAATAGVNAHFFGGSDNALRVVQKSATGATPSGSVATTVNISTCPLTPLRGTSGPAAPWGVVASGTSWTATDDVTDRLALPSSDGTVYALNWASCTANAAYCSSTTHTVSPDTLGAGSCVAWTFASPRNFTFLSPPRYIEPLTGPPLVLVSDTAPGGLYTGATTYALNSETGAQVWNHTHSAVNGTWYGSVGVVPAFDAVDGLVFLAYGPGVVALNGATGKVVGNWSGAGDIVVASPSLIVGDNGGAGSWSVFLHTSLGTLWSLAVSQSGATGAVTFTPAWKCDYQYFVQAPVSAACTRYASPSEAGGAAAEAVQAPLLGEGFHRGAEGSSSAGSSFTALRGDFSAPGGWYQPTSAAQRAALWAAIRKRYAAAFPLGPPSPLLPQHTLGLPKGTDTEAVEVSLMAAALPATSLAELRTGVDWAASGEAGVAGFRLVSAPSGGAGALGASEYSSSFPYATPTLSNSGARVLLAQYTALGSAATAFFVASTLDGSVAATYANKTIFGPFGTSITITFGRSRASPAVDGNGNVYGAGTFFPSLFPLPCPTRSYPPPPPPLPLPPPFPPLNSLCSQLPLTPPLPQFRVTQFPTCWPFLPAR